MVLESGAKKGPAARLFSRGRQVWLILVRS